MKDIGIKFTVYDFLGYFIPGLLLIAIISLNKCYLDDFSFSQEALIKMFNELNLNLLIFGVFICYLLGFLLNAIGAALIESFFFTEIKYLRRKVDCIELLPDLTIERFKIRYKEVYGINYSENDKHSIIVYVAENKPQVYGRAFFFLVIYGFSRTVMMVLMLNCIFLFYYLFTTYWAWFQFCMSALFLMVFFFNYIKFRQYYEKESLYGFLLS
jgi:hypothetical protein